MSKILVADDHPLFREAIGQALATFVGHEEHQIFEAGTVASAIQVVEQHRDFDLLLLDIYMPGMEGLTGLVEVRKLFPALPVVIVTASEDPSMLRRVLACGAAGYIPKTYDRAQISAALIRVMSGEVFRPPHLDVDAVEVFQDANDSIRAAERLRLLTPQQFKVLRAMIAGKPNKIIAYELDIAEKTVKVHITAILKKLGVSSRTQAVLATHHLLTAFEWPRS